MLQQPYSDKHLKCPLPPRVIAAFQATPLDLETQHRQAARLASAVQIIAHLAKLRKALPRKPRGNTCAPYVTGPSRILKIWHGTKETSTVQRLMLVPSVTSYLEGRMFSRLIRTCVFRAPTTPTASWEVSMQGVRFRKLALGESLEGILDRHLEPIYACISQSAVGPAIAIALDDEPPSSALLLISTLHRDSLT